jgi:hypothetical protein
MYLIILEEALQACRRDVDPEIVGVSNIGNTLAQFWQQPGVKGKVEICEANTT